jgi:hypothetical protein
MVRNFKTRFLDESPEGLWVQLTPDAGEVLRQAAETDTTLAISFTNGTQRVSIATRIVQIDQAHQINAHTTMAAVLVERPQKVVALQRRNSYRVAVLTGSDLQVRIWSIAERAQLTDRPLVAQEVKVTPRDISMGGIGITLACTDATRRLVANQRLRVQITFLDQELLMEARLRTRPVPPGAAEMRAGIIFKKLEQDVVGRRNLATLTRIIGQLQREEIRRVKLGLA